jgi:hypothetical protein
MVNTLLAIVSRYMEFDYNEKVFFIHTLSIMLGVLVCTRSLAIDVVCILKQVVTSTIELSVKSGD